MQRNTKFLVAVVLIGLGLSSVAQGYLPENTDRNIFRADTYYVLPAGGTTYIVSLYNNTHYWINTNRDYIWEYTGTLQASETRKFDELPHATIIQADKPICVVTSWEYSTRGYWSSIAAQSTLGKNFVIPLDTPGKTFIIPVETDTTLYGEGGQIIARLNDIKSPLQMDFPSGTIIYSDKPVSVVERYTEHNQFYASIPPVSSIGIDYVIPVDTKGKTYLAAVEDNTTVEFDYHIVDDFIDSTITLNKGEVKSFDLAAGTRIHTDKPICVKEI